jgi:hypothetical protein
MFDWFAGGSELFIVPARRVGTPPWTLQRPSSNINLHQSPLSLHSLWHWNSANAPANSHGRAYMTATQIIIAPYWLPVLDEVAKRDRPSGKSSMLFCKNEYVFI